MDLHSLLITLPMMGLGMLGIFVIMGIIYGFVLLLSKLFNEKA